MFDLQHLAIAVPAFLLAITLHEAAHAWVAFRLGDPTARDLGRVTLNPIKHLDPLGTIVFFIAGFGWAKPVPVDLRNLDEPVRDHMYIAAAGPGANIVLAVLSATLFRIVYMLQSNGAGLETLGDFLFYSMTINIILAVFNMIPIMPLDGSAVLAGLLPEKYVPAFDRLNALGPMLLFGAIILGNVTGHSIIWRVLGPPVEFLQGVLLWGIA